jgi:hypothetical protein
MLKIGQPARSYNFSRDLSEILGIFYVTFDGEHRSRGRSSSAALGPLQGAAASVDQAAPATEQYQSGV